MHSDDGTDRQGTDDDGKDGQTEDDDGDDGTDTTGRTDRGRTMTTERTRGRTDGRTGRGCRRAYLDQSSNAKVYPELEDVSGDAQQVPPDR